MRSVVVVLSGMVLAVVAGLLLVFGIFAPLLTTILGSRGFNGALAGVLMAFSAAVAFYFGGMSAAYRAPSRRALHGLLVGIIPYVFAPLVNLAGGLGPFPRINSVGDVELAVALVVVSVGAAYVGGRRGEALYAHHRRLAARPGGARRRQRSSGKRE